MLKRTFAVLHGVDLRLRRKGMPGLHVSHKCPPHLTQKAVLCGIGQSLFGSSTCNGAIRTVPAIMQGNGKNSFSSASHSTTGTNTGAQELHLSKTNLQMHIACLPGFGAT